VYRGPRRPVPPRRGSGDGTGGTGWYAVAMTGRRWLCASDLHGRADRYAALWAAVESMRPEAVLLAGDLLPGGPGAAAERFVETVFRAGVWELRARLGTAAPAVALVLGNDDERRFEAAVEAGEREGLWLYLHQRRAEVGGLTVAGYGCVPPTPFLLKDFERYDVSRYVAPGAVSPEAGRRTVPARPDDVRFGTIQGDLARLVAGLDPDATVLLCHCPPYGTCLDRADLDGRRVDHVPLDVHVGSIALRRLIERWQPRWSVHGHVHECVRLTGRHVERIGRTTCLSSAHDGPETAILVVDPDAPWAAERLLV